MLILHYTAHACWLQGMIRGWCITEPPSPVSWPWIGNFWTKSGAQTPSSSTARTPTSTRSQSPTASSGSTRTAGSPSHRGWQSPPGVRCISANFLSTLRTVLWRLGALVTPALTSSTSGRISPSGDVKLTLTITWLWLPQHGGAEPGPVRHDQLDLRGRPTLHEAGQQVRHFCPVHFSEDTRLLLPPDLHPSHNHCHELLGLVLACQDKSGVTEIPAFSSIIRIHILKFHFRARRFPPGQVWALQVLWPWSPSGLEERPSPRSPTPLPWMCSSSSALSSYFSRWQSLPFLASWMFTSEDTRRRKK